jgi:hypothetical protein
MIDVKFVGVSHRRSLFVWALFCTLGGTIFLAYAFASLAAGQGGFVMPLDDVYIHFQYAKQMALGQPYIYNPGLPPTSGATSFLYPYMLAIGYLLGFQGLNLGLWAMLLGMVALVVSTWLVYQLAKIWDASEWLSIGTGVIFALCGPVSWHFMSGMETGWVVLFVLWTVYAFAQWSIHADGVGRQRSILNVVLPATLLALIRPEGGILAVLAMAAVLVGVRFHRTTHKSSLRKRNYLWLLVPVLAIGVQPLVNLVLTGSAVASGNAAKSIFGMIPFYWDEVIRRILDNWARVWGEFLTGSSPREGLYLAPLMLVIAFAGVIWLFADRRWRAAGLMLVGWLVFGTLAISTLDTAFWHFKRYQMPFIAPLFPLAACGVAVIWRWIVGTGYSLSLRYVLYGLVLIVGVISVWTWAPFLHHYALNVDYVNLQPLQMARWLQVNTPPDAVVAVHDTGLLRYEGGRTTIDMVGLTTPGAADYWRNGPGSVAEFLIQERPDYIASYGHGHGFGLGMLADTSLYGEPLASFPVKLDANYNVALAADFQGIYHLKGISQRTSFPVDVNIWNYVYYGGVSFVDEINVGDLQSEKDHNYRWRNDAGRSGFPTEIHEFRYMNCLVGFGDTCPVIDGGRLISGEESFRFSVESDKDVILATRLHPQQHGTFDVYANDSFVATRWIPELPGQWIDVPTLIPAEYITANELQIRIVPHVEGGFYMPYYHWLWQGDYQPDFEIAGLSPDEASVLGIEETVSKTSFEQGLFSAHVRLQSLNLGGQVKPLYVNIDWGVEQTAEGDYKVFVHVMDEHDQIVAQTDSYPANTWPPGNWLPGVLRDTIMVDLGETSPGEYRVVMGLYNPYTGERLQPEGGDEQGRFFIGEIEVQ